MAGQIYLLTKADAESPNQTYINDIHACIQNADDGDPDATKIAEAIAVARLAGHPLPDGYFDTVQFIGAETGGIMDTDEDQILILRRSTVETIA